LIDGQGVLLCLPLSEGLSGGLDTKVVTKVPDFGPVSRNEIVAR
jgi:hypothetical protein